MKRLMIIADHSLVVHAIRLALRQTAGFQLVEDREGMLEGLASGAALACAPQGHSLRQQCSGKVEGLGQRRVDAKGTLEGGE